MAYISAFMTLEEILVKEKKSTVEKPLEENEEIETVQKVSIQQLAFNYSIIISGVQLFN